MYDYDRRIHTWANFGNTVTKHTVFVMIYNVLVWWVQTPF